MLQDTVVVDGSNIATEGRNTPSLKQLDEAVQAFLAEHPTDNLVVVVDATFGHRIDQKERPEYEEAILAGEIITPPAGAIGRGDAFILQIADKANATVLSNDSFQELHGKYPWLFDEGRLIGGKPVPGLGWVFLLRTPVRGPVSRKSLRDAKNGRGRRRGRAEEEPVKQTPIKAGSGVDDAERRSRTKKPSKPLNDPLPFIEFVGAHPVGSAVKGEIVEFSSHGAYVMVSGARCYVPLRLMGNPPPRSARDAIKIGEERVFVVYSLDPPRRGIDLALAATAGAADADGSPVTTTSDATAKRAAKKASMQPAKRSGVKRGRETRNDGVAREAEVEATDVDVSRAEGPEAKKANTQASALATTSAADQHAEEAPVTPAAKKKAAPKRAAKKTAKRSTAKKATRKAAPKRTAKKTARKTTKKATAKRTAKKAPARKKAAKKSTAKRTAKKAPARKKKAAKKSTAKRTAKKAPARKKAAKRTTARKR